MNKWDYTRKKYVNWLSETDLRKEFSKKIKFENLSLWWLSDLMSKDNINESEWYIDLNKKLNHKKNKHQKRRCNYFYLFINLLKKIILKVISYIFINIFFSNKKDILPKRDCYYGLYTNFVNHNGQFIDRQYGRLTTKNKNSKIYIIELPENFFLIKNIFKIKKNLRKVPLNYIISNKELKFFDILKIFGCCYQSLLMTIKILKKKNYFFINKINCKDILEKKLINSFFGPIQDQLLKAKALQCSLNKISVTNFINCYDFYPQARAFYYFSKKTEVKNIVNVNHAIYFKNDLNYGFNSNDFSKSNSSFFSPKPDYFFSQGLKYYKELRKTFGNKNVFCTGSLKVELNKFILKSKINRKSKNLKKKTILLLCGINDYNAFIHILNQCKLDNWKILVAPHPLKKNNTIRSFREKLKIDFTNVSLQKKEKLFSKCDYIICGNAILGYELAIRNYNVLRVCHKDFIPTFDINNEVPTAKNKREFLKLISKSKISQKSKFIEKNYFYKYDMKTSNRIEKILENL